MPRILRLLPLTALIAFLALGLKVGEIMRGGQILVISLAGEAKAEQAKPAESPAKTESKPSEASPKEDTPKVTPPSTEAKTESETGEEEEEKQNKRDFSQVEIDLLQSLAKRRDELDQWAKQIQLKENMLIATEQRINEKIGNLERMKKDVEVLLAQYNEQEDIKIRSLVKIYENMKPRDAARIFEELDMPILLTVVDRMSERKVAPILAGMNPGRAKDLTVQLAEQRKLQKPRSGGGGSEQESSAQNTADTAAPVAASAPATAAEAPAAAPASSSSAPASTP